MFLCNFKNADYKHFLVILLNNFQKPLKELQKNFSAYNANNL